MTSSVVDPYKVPDLVTKGSILTGQKAKAQDMFSPMQEVDDGLKAVDLFSALDGYDVDVITDSQTNSVFAKLLNKTPADKKKRKGKGKKKSKGRS